VPAAGEEFERTFAADQAELDGFLAARRSEGIPALIILGVRGCPPCLEVWGMISELPPELRRRVVGVRIDEAPDIAERIPAYGVPWLVAVGADGRMVAGVAPDTPAAFATLLTQGPPVEPAPAP
jgi:hypothetical protein